MDLLGHLRRAVVLAGPLLLAAPLHAAPLLPDSVTGWRAVGAPGAIQTRIDSTQKHGGATSAHVRFSPQDMQVPSNIPGEMRDRLLANGSIFSQSLDATPYRARRVRLSVWVRTALPEKPAPKMPVSKVQVFMRILNADTTQTVYDGSVSPIVATTDWIRKVVVLEVAPDANVITYGINGVGSGDVWIDDVVLEDQAPAMGPYDKKPLPARPAMGGGRGGAASGPTQATPPSPANRPTEVVNGDFEK